MVYMDFPHSSVGRESTCNAGDPCSIPGAGGSPGKGIGYPLQYSCSLVAQLVKNHLQCEDLGSIPGLGRSPGEGKIYPLQYSGMENSMDCTVHGVAKSWTQLRGLHFTICIQVSSLYKWVLLSFCFPFPF